MSFSVEHKAAVNLAKAVSNVTFDNRSFGRMLAEDHPLIQARTMWAVLGFIEAMADKITTDSMTDANADAIVTAARIRDALEVYSTD